MNERIQELEAQCWEPKQYGPPWFNSKKFAELLVRECCEMMQGFTFEEIATKVIKKNFGVEE
jgi:hypothetical protein